MIDSIKQRLLEHTRFFLGLEKPQIDRVLAIAEQVVIEAQTIIIQEGVLEDSIWLIASGEVEVLKTIQHQVEKSLVFLNNGDVLGELEFLEQGPRSASARTTQRSEFLKIGRSAFDELVSQDPSIGSILYRNLAQTMAERLRQTNELYRDSVAYGLEAVGAAGLNLNTFIQDLSQLQISLSNGQIITGQILQVDQNQMGYVLIIKDQETGKILLVPYHSIQAIEV